MFGLGMHVFFPMFILEVDTAADYHLHYVPIGRGARLPDLDYVQPKLAPKTVAPANAATTQLAPASATIEPNNDSDAHTQPSFASHWPKHPPSPQHPPLDMSLLPPSPYTQSLKDLDREELIQCLYMLDSQHDQSYRQAKGTSTALMECIMSTKAIA